MVGLSVWSTQMGLSTIALKVLHAGIMVAYYDEPSECSLYRSEDFGSSSAATNTERTLVGKNRRLEIYSEIVQVSMGRPLSNLARFAGVSCVMDSILS